MSDRVLHCWFDFGESTCMLPDEHDGPHEPTPDSEISIRFDDVAGGIEVAVGNHE